MSISPFSHSWSSGWNPSFTHSQGGGSWHPSWTGSWHQTWTNSWQPSWTNTWQHSWTNTWQRSWTNTWQPSWTGTWTGTWHTWSATWSWHTQSHPTYTWTQYWPSNTWTQYVPTAQPVPGCYPNDPYCNGYYPPGFQQVRVTPVFSAPGGQVSVSGSGFLPTDTTCTISSPSSPNLILNGTAACIIQSGTGIAVGGFIIGYVLPGNYVVQIIGDQGDFAQAIVVVQ